MDRTNMSIANKVCDFFEFWYYQYILVTALYMLESWERAVFSILGKKHRIGAGSNQSRVRQNTTATGKMWTCGSADFSGPENDET